MYKCKILCAFLILFLCSGCWDAIEIEQRGFVIGTGIDLNDEKNLKEDAPLKLTQQFVVPSGLGMNADSGQALAFQNIVSSGNTMFETVRRVAARTSRSPFYEHIKLIVFSERVAKSDYFPDVLDYFLRYPEMRRGTQVMITPENAFEILEVRPANEKLPTMYIQSISKNNYKNARMIPATRIGDLHEKLLDNNSFMVQMVKKMNEEEVKIAGHAVFNGHSDKLVGFIGEEATEGVNFITGEIEGGLLEAKVDDDIVVYELEEVKTDITPSYTSPDDITFKVKIETSGSIPETYKSFDLLKDQDWENIEHAIEKRVYEFTEIALQEIQKKLQTDIFTFGETLSVKYPHEWEKIKDKWDNGENYFKEAKVDVTVTSVISKSGAINRSTLQ
jgi:spore germination protein